MNLVLLYDVNTSYLKSIGGIYGSQKWCEKVFFKPKYHEKHKFEEITFAASEFLTTELDIKEYMQRYLKSNKQVSMSRVLFGNRKIIIKKQIFRRITVIFLIFLFFIFYFFIFYFFVF